MQADGLDFDGFLRQVTQGLPDWTSRAELALTDAAMAQLSDAWQSATQRGQSHDLINWLRASPQRLAGGYARALAARLEEELAAPAALDHFRNPALLDTLDTTLSLMDEQEVEAGIEQVRIERQIDQAGEWSLRELRGLCGNLHCRPMHLAGNAYPLTPEVCAEAFGQALKDLHCPGPMQLALMRLAAPALSRELAKVYEAHLSFLRDAGVTPAIPVIRQAGGVGLNWGETAAAPSAPATARPAHSPNMAAHRPTMPASSSGAVASSAAQAVPEQVAQLLEILARQTHAGSAMAPVWQRLQAPLARLNPQELAALQQDDHPFWRLLDRIAALSSVQSREDAEMRELAEQLEPVLAQLDAPAGLRTTVDFDSALADLDAMPAPRPLVSPQALESALDHEARRRDVEPAVRAQLADQLRPLALPPVLKQFLLGPWAQVLTRVIARDGTQAAGTQRLMNLVPDLLDAASLLRRGQPLPPLQRQALLDAAQDGMDAAGLPAHMVQGYHADLARVLSGTPAQADEAPTMVITPAMLAQAKGEAPPPAPAASPTPPEPAWRESGMDEWQAHAQLTTVPMAMADDAEAAQAARAAWLDSLKAGDLCRLMLQGRWTTAQLTWRSDNGQFFLFKSRHAAGSHTLTRRSFDRLRREGLATRIEPGQMLARARAALA